MAIKVQTGFNVATPGPIDERTTVETIEARDTIANKYDGLIVYVEATQKVYVFKNGTWKELVEAPEVDGETLIFK